MLRSTSAGWVSRPFNCQQRRWASQNFHAKRVLRLPKQHMYSIVGDVAKYQEFVPYCLESSVKSDGGSDSPTLALLRVGWNQLDETFVSKVTYSPNQVLAAAADNKMFKELACEWTIEELNPSQCAVELNLRFEFQNALYDLMARSAGGLISKRMIEAFTKRAMQLKKNTLNKADS